MSARLVALFAWLLVEPALGQTTYKLQALRLFEKEKPAMQFNTAPNGS